jgi:hypothetical protein
MREPAQVSLVVAHSGERAKLGSSETVPYRASWLESHCNRSFFGYIDR